MSSEDGEAPDASESPSGVPADIFKRRRGHDLLTDIATELEEFLDIMRHDHYNARQAGLYAVLSLAYDGLGLHDTAQEFAARRDAEVALGRKPVKLRHVPTKAEREARRKGR